MYAKTLLTAVLFASSSVASIDVFGAVNARTIVARQSSAFQPGTTSGSGSTCAAAFGGSYVTCGNGGKTCFDPNAGESCCAAGYPCPSDSFCLTDGFCCPNGIDAATCAKQNGLTLSSGFNTSPATSTPSASAPPNPSDALTTSSSKAASVTPPLSTGAAPAASGFPAPGITPVGNATFSATGAPTNAKPSPSQFTGGAPAQHALGGAGLFAGLLVLGALI